jgi:hypothetical protein
VRDVAVNLLSVNDQLLGTFFGNIGHSFSDVSVDIAQFLNPTAPVAEKIFPIKSHRFVEQLHLGMPV